MNEGRIYEQYKGSKNEPELIDKEFAYPIAYRLQLLYKKELKESAKQIKKVKIEEFAQFIGRIFDIPVPKICIVKSMEMKKEFDEEDILGVCIMKEKECKEIWLQKEMVKSKDGNLIYSILIHELRHCWQGKSYDKYYGKNKDTKDLEAFREADAQAFSELIFYYLFEGWYSYQCSSPEEKKMREKVKDIKDDIRIGLWEQIRKYYSKNGDAKTFEKIKKLDQMVYRDRK